MPWSQVQVGLKTYVVIVREPLYMINCLNQVQFWLGTHRPYWLERTDVPLMVSTRTLSKRKTLPLSRGPWVLDSGGFSELSMYGNWLTSPKTYAELVERYSAEIGQLAWAAIQDWMCEPWILKKTGLDMREHQLRSVVSYLELRLRSPDVPWCPVLQGWQVGDYLRHAEMYERAGVQLRDLPIVGIGSVCRRQGTRGAVDLLVRLSGEGMRLHGFGLKTTALRALSPFLASSDSMAWSYEAMKRGIHCERGTPCANHMHYALDWRDRVLESMGTDSVQFGLPWES
jgi:hypothetical protein